MNHERRRVWLFLISAADTMTNDWWGLCRLFWKQIFTTLFNLSFSFTVIDPNHTVIANVRTLSVKGQHDLCGQTKRFIKYNRRYAFVTIVPIFSSHLRLLEIVGTRNLKCWTIPTVLPSIKRGERGEELFLLKSTINCFVLFTPDYFRLFAWSRYSD